MDSKSQEMASEKGIDEEIERVVVTSIVQFIGKMQIKNRRGPKLQEIGTIVAKQHPSFKKSIGRGAQRFAEWLAKYPEIFEIESDSTTTNLGETIYKLRSEKINDDEPPTKKRKFTEPSSLNKYDSETGSKILQWINRVSGQSIDTNGDHENFIAVLKDGSVLHNLANAVEPESIKKINTSSMASEQPEDAQFVGSVSEHESSQTVDLFERQDRSTAAATEEETTNDVSLRCDCCNITFQSKRLYRSHCRSKRRLLYALAKSQNEPKAESETQPKPSTETVKETEEAVVHE